MKKFLLILLFFYSKSAYAEKELFRCKTEKHLILITESKPETYHYRSWNLPKTTNEKPDVDIKNGEQKYEGTGVCGTNYFTFKSGKISYLVADSANCGPGDTPENAIGSVDVLVNNEQKSSYWCLR